MKGKIKKIENKWVVDVPLLIDPYGQIPHPIPLHPDSYDKLNEEGTEIEFELELETVYQYYAKLKK